MNTLAETNEAVQFKVATACYWAETGVCVEKGRRYRIEVVDMSSVKDAIIPVNDLEGWPWLWARVLYSPLFWTRRRAFDPWFALIATVDRRQPRRLRERQVYDAPASGRLVCYFNDAPFAYCNDYHGVAKLRIVPLGPAPHANRP